MANITVANQSGLLNAFATAKGGDTIILKDGYYGAVKVTADYSSTVTVRAEGALDATIGNLQVVGASNLRFDGIKFDSGGNGGNGSGIVSILSGSQNVQVVNSEVTGSVDGVYAGHYGIYVRDSNGITLESNKVHDVQAGVVIFGSANSNVRNNSIDYFSEDGMKLSGLNNVNIQGNNTLGHIYPTAGAHNDFMQFQGSSSNVTVSENLFLPVTTGWVQGIYLSDGTYNNININNNVVYTGMARGISVSDGSGIQINNNTVLNAQGFHSNTRIFAPDGSSVNNNVSSNYVGLVYGSNLEVQNANPSAAYYVNNYYKNGAAGLGVTLQDLTPVAGSVAESKGASALLKALLGGSAPAPTPAPDPTPSAPSAPSAPTTSGDVAINAGGGASSGFAADSYFSGGGTYNTGAGIAGTTADAIYQTERYGTFAYSVGVANGTYDVTLKFAEIYFDKAGQRVFDVKAENQIVLDNLDIYANAGKNVALDKTIRVAVNDGKLDLQFIGVTENAKVSGIDISPASGSAPAPAAPAPSGGTGIAVNAGGGASNGFAADAFYFGGSTYSTSAGIAGTSADAIYQTERYGNFKYSAAVSNGTHDVTLKFAEIYLDKAGQRVFDVKAENQLVLDNYDVYREAGGKNVAHDETFQVNVTDGKLDLDFISVIENAKVSGIEIDGYLL